MPFKNRKFVKRITMKPCEWCGWQSAHRDAAHIIDEEKSSKEWNALSLCPNCSRIFDDKIRPKLYQALKVYGAKNLPNSWKKSNKISKN
jgi:hypothetical protein